MIPLYLCPIRKHWKAAIPIAVCMKYSTQPTKYTQRQPNSKHSMLSCAPFWMPYRNRAGAASPLSAAITGPGEQGPRRIPVGTRLRCDRRRDYLYVLSEADEGRSITERPPFCKRWPLLFILYLIPYFAQYPRTISRKRSF